MSERLQPPPLAKFVFAVAWGAPSPHEECQAALTEALGPLDSPGPSYSFSEVSDYYDHEIGKPTHKYLISLRELLPVDRAVSIKLLAETLEDQFAAGKDHSRRRTVNVDPGYLTGWQFVLTTVKKNAHRIYLDRGVFAEVTLLYRKGRFRTLPWTYPDYRRPAVLEQLTRIRDDYRERIGKLKG